MPSKKRKRAASVKSRPSLVKPTRSRLLDLPLEIRQKIFETFFQLPGLRSTCDRTCGDVCRHPEYDYMPLLLVCRQFHTDIWPIYTLHRSFAFANPIRLANDFLSFLPRQRLCAVRHLKLVDLDRECLAHEMARFSSDLERTWWYYLDVFSRLDTLTIDLLQTSGDPYYGQLSYALVRILIGMLEQGSPKRPKWMGRKTHEPFHTTSSDLAASHDWQLDFGTRSRSQDFRNTTCYRIRLRRRHTEQDRVESLFHGWCDRSHAHPKSVCGYSPSWPTGVGQVLDNAVTTSNWMAVSTSRADRQNNELVIYHPRHIYSKENELLRCKLGQGTKLRFEQKALPLLELQNPADSDSIRDYCFAETVTVVGRWINTRSDA